MAELHVNKLAAASRLIDAAIAMLVVDADDLAICVVAGSARKMLSELKTVRGGSHVGDLLRWGLFYMARDHVAGRLPKDAYVLPGILEALEPIARLIEAGEVASPDDLSVDVPLGADREYWRKANVAFNFLKHADRDPDQMLDMSKVDALMVTVEACAIYKQLGAPLTDHMISFGRQMDARPAIAT